jgi:molybdopterin converting factor small subunit
VVVRREKVDTPGNTSLSLSETKGRLKKDEENENEPNLLPKIVSREVGHRAILGHNTRVKKGDTIVTGVIMRFYSTKFKKNWCRLERA